MVPELQHQYELLDLDGKSLGFLRLENGRLVADVDDPDVHDLLDLLQAHKRLMFWRPLDWDLMLRAYALSEASTHCPVRLSAPVAPGTPEQDWESLIRDEFHLSEFYRRWCLIEMLLVEPLPREQVLSQMLGQVLFESPEDVRAMLRGESERKLRAVPGLSGPTLSGDVADLRRLGVGFERSPKLKTRQPFKLDTALLPLFVSPAEAETLRIGLDLLQELNLPTAAGYEAIYQRIPDAVRAQVPSTNIDQLLASTSAAIDAETFALLRAAIHTRRPIRIWYQSALANEAKQYYVEHPHFMWAEGSLYLVGHCPRERGRQAVEKNREFRLDRFQPIPGKQLVEELSGPSTTAEMPAFWVKFRAHPSFAPRFRPVDGLVKVSAPAPDGACVVQIREEVPLRAVRRVLSYGEMVTLLGPDYVVAQYRGVVDQIARSLDG